jgi:hypothetical protein
MPSFRGKPACSCLAESLPWVEKVMLAKGLIRHSLDVYQIIGGASASAGTHRTGGAVDTAQYSDAQLRVWRDMGYDASWKRTVGQGFSLTHHHGVARGCPHNSPARYQIAAVDANYNGLGYQGRNARDNGPRPLSGRTWQQGIEWAKSFLTATPWPPQPLTMTVGFWNVGSPKWFGPWAPRKQGICDVLTGLRPDVLVTAETHFTYMTTDILAALGVDYAHVSSPVGTDQFYRRDLFAQTAEYVEYPMKIQGRAAGVLHLQHRDSGKRVAVIGSHAPALIPSYKTIFGRNLARLVAQVDDARIVAGDWNRTSNKAPRSSLEGLGFRAERSQVNLVNESADEFPGKGWLSGIYTKPSEARIVGGQLHLTSPRLSDHRPFVTRIQIP